MDHRVKFGVNDAHRNLIEARLQLVSKAYGRFSPTTIKPVAGKEKLVDCFQVEGKQLQFWYNVGNDTHMEVMDL